MADSSSDFAVDETSPSSDSDTSTIADPESEIPVDMARHDIEKVASHHSQVSHRSHSEVHRIRTAEDWTGPDDPGNPLNWGIGKKLIHTLVPALQCFTITFGSSVYTPGVHSVEKEFHVSFEAAIVGLSLYVLGLAFGPIISAPISETYGRKITYVAIFLPSLLFTLGAGLAQNYATLLVCRFLAGFFGSGCLAIGAGTNSDIWAPIHRATASGFFILAPFLGPALGPPVGGFAAQAKGWRWTQWPILMIGAVAWLITLFSEETYKKIILKKRAKKNGLPPPPNLLPPSFGARMKFIFIVTVLRPIRMLLTEPIVAFLSIYTAFNFSVLFGFFDAFPFVFSSGEIYHFNTGESGLAFLGLGVGCVLGTLLFILVDRRFYRRKTMLRRKSGDMTHLPPEERLYAAMLGSLCLPVGLFWFAWTARRDVHWIVPIVATVPFATGNLLVFCSTVLYLIDTYGPLLGASAAAANGVLRYITGAVFPLFTLQMYRALGVGWATSLLGFVTLGLLPIPWVLYRWGLQIRKRSGYAQTVAAGARAGAGGK